MKKKMNENSAGSPFKERNPKKEKQTYKETKKINTEYNLICKKLTCFSVTTKFSRLMI